MPATKRDKKKILFAIFLIGVLLLAVVAIEAYGTRLQYDINLTRRSIQDCERQIQNLEVRIRSANNINNLESRALALGLVYPDFSQIVYIHSEKDVGGELALALKETVYTQ